MSKQEVQKQIRQQQRMQEYAAAVRYFVRAFRKRRQWADHFVALSLFKMGDKTGARIWAHDAILSNPFRIATYDLLRRIDSLPETYTEIMKRAYCSFDVDAKQTLGDTYAQLADSSGAPEHRAFAQYWRRKAEEFRYWEQHYKK